MKVVRKCIMTMLMLIPCMLWGQGIHTHGTDFWVAFFPVPYDTDVWGLEHDDLSIFITGEDSCSGMITNPITGWHHSFQVAPDSLSVIQVPVNTFLPTQLGTPLPKSLHIVSDDTIAVWSGITYEAANHTANFGLTNILPTEVLGCNYVIQTASASYSPYEMHQGYGNFALSFAIVAIMDSTHVHVYPRCSTQSGYHYGDTIDLWLDSGEVYLEYSVLPTESLSVFDLNGSPVVGVNNKPFALFVGAPEIFMPKEIANLDVIYEQSYPIEYWGNRYLAMACPLVDSNHTVVRNQIIITAQENNTMVFRDGMMVAQLNAGFSYNDTIRMQDGGVLYSSNKNIGVAQFMFSCARPSEGETSHGNPAMVLLPPVEQMSSHMHFATPWSSYSDQRFFHLQVFTPTENVEYMMLNDSSISHHFMPVRSNPAYSCARFQITEGVYNLYATNNGVFDARLSGSRTSSGYIALLSHQRIIDSYLYVDSRPVEQIPHDSLFCIHDTVEFMVETTRFPDHIYWHFGDNSAVDSGFYVQHLFQQPGTYRVACELIYPSLNTYWPPRRDTLFYTIKVIGPFDTVISVTQCEGPYYFHGGEFDASGTEVLVFEGISTCDSTFTLHLDLYGRWTTHTDTIYEDQLPWEFFNTTFHSDVTNIELHRDDGQECDSVVVYTLHVLWNQFSNMVPDSTFIWVPNAFIPSDPVTNRFQVVTYDVADIQVWIYNRQGLLVKQWQGLEGFWDGNGAHGQPCSQGAYVYHIRYKPNKHGWRTTTGSVTLIR